MLRTAFLTASLCALVACDRAPTAPPPLRVAPVATPAKTSLKGIVRIIGGDSTDVQFNLELRDGSMVRLIGDPVGQLAMYQDQQVLVTGVYEDGVMLVESYSTEILIETNRRRR